MYETETLVCTLTNGSKVDVQATFVWDGSIWELNEYELIGDIFADDLPETDQQVIRDQLIGYASRIEAHDDEAESDSEAGDAFVKYAITGSW